MYLERDSYICIMSPYNHIIMWVVEDIDVEGTVEVLHKTGGSVARTETGLGPRYFVTVTSTNVFC